MSKKSEWGKTETLHDKFENLVNFDKKKLSAQYSVICNYMLTRICEKVALTYVMGFLSCASLMLVSVGK